MPIYENISTGKKVEVAKGTLMSKAYKLVTDKKPAEAKAKEDKKPAEAKAKEDKKPAEAKADK